MRALEVREDLEVRENENYDTEIVIPLVDVDSIGFCPTIHNKKLFPAITLLGHHLVEVPLMDYEKLLWEYEGIALYGRVNRNG